MKKVKLFLLVFVTVTLTCFFGCTQNVELIDNYSAYISNLFQYYLDDVPSEIEKPNGDISDEPDYKPTLAADYDGLTKISEYEFEDGIKFFGKHAYVELNGDGYFLDLNGKLQNLCAKDDGTITDIVLEGVFCDKLLLKQGNLYGVSDLNGNLITEIMYDSIEISERIVVAKRSGVFDVFIDDKLKHSVNGEILLVLSDELINLDGKIYFADDMQTAKISEYFIAEAPHDGIVKVFDDNKNFGYCSYPEGKILIKPEYFIAGTFSNGYSCVYNYKADFVNMIFNDYPQIIDLNQNVLFDFSVFKDEILPNKIQVFMNFDGYNVFYFDSPGSPFGLVDLNDVPVSCRMLPITPKYGRVFGDLCISREYTNFYSVSKDAVIGDSFADIQNFCNKFIVEKTNGAFALLDSELNIIVDDCEKIEAYNDTLLIKKNKKIAYYRNA